MDSGTQSRRSFVAAAGITAVLLRANVAAASSLVEDGSRQGAWKSVELIGINGQAITLSQISAPVVVVHVWASWCAACLGEMPSLQDWAARLNPAEVAPVLVSHPKHWDADTAFLRRTGVQLPAYTIAPDTAWEMRAAVFNIVGGSFAIPRTLVFAGRDRHCVMTTEGPENWRSAQLAARLRTWLRSTPA